MLENAHVSRRLIQVDRRQVYIKPEDPRTLGKKARKSIVVSSAKIFVIWYSTMVNSLTTIISAIALAQLTWAHGYVDNATIGGVYYQVWEIESSARNENIPLTV